MNVSHIFTGSLHKFTDEFRITAHLSEIDEQIWSHNYDSKNKNFKELQDSVSNAIALMLVETLSSGIFRNKISMSSSEEIDTPTLPTSPEAIESSESYPIWVGKSKATDSPF